MAKLDQRQISDQLVRLVQLFFGFVFAQSLLALRPVILEPFQRDHWVAAVAIPVVCYTVVSSWIDWHVTMAYSPYDARHLCAFHAGLGCHHDQDSNGLRRRGILGMENRSTRKGHGAGHESDGTVHKRYSL
jgi:hypothetical protein